MKRLFKSIKWLLLSVVALGAIVGFARNIAARRGVELAAKEMTGFPLEIGSVNIGLFSGTLEVRDLKLMNPPQFHGGTFVILPLVRADYDAMSFLRRTPHIKELVVNVSEIDIVKNEKGDTNAAALQKSVSSIVDGGGTANKTKKMPYRVDLVKVHIGTLIRRTFGGDGKPREKKINLNIDATYRDVNESTSISKLIMDSVFGQVGVAAVETIKAVDSTLKGGTDALKKTAKGLLGVFRKKR